MSVYLNQFKYIYAYRLYIKVQSHFSALFFFNSVISPLSDTIQINQLKWKWQSNKIFCVDLKPNQKFKFISDLNCYTEYLSVVRVRYALKQKNVFIYFILFPS
jgi:hypothetical protein